MLTIFHTRLYFLSAITILIFVLAGTESTGVRGSGLSKAMTAFGLPADSGEAEPSVSPSGQEPAAGPLLISAAPKIVFGSVRNGGNHDIFLMDLDGSNQVRLTTSGAYDDQPKWSPD